MAAVRSVEPESMTTSWWINPGTRSSEWIARQMSPTVSSSFSAGRQTPIVVRSRAEKVIGEAYAYDQTERLCYPIAMKHLTGLVCKECGRDYPVAAQHACEFCFGPLEVAYDYESIGAEVSRESIAGGPQTLWRYASLLPDPATERIDLGAGWTR